MGWGYTSLATLNPGQRRGHLPSRLQGRVRLSFGPTLEEVGAGLDRLAELCGA